MKKILLLIGLISLLVNSAFSQQENILDPNYKNWTFSQQPDSNLLKIFNYSMVKDSMSKFPEDNHYIQKWELHQKRIMDDNMTILKPIGNYPSKIIYPDTTIRYTLLIRKP